jgi:hypothetical protein
VLFEGRIETINFQENFDLQVTLVSTPALHPLRSVHDLLGKSGASVRRESAAYSTNGLLL